MSTQSPGFVILFNAVIATLKMLSTYDLKWEHQSRTYKKQQSWKAMGQVMGFRGLGHEITSRYREALEEACKIEGLQFNVNLFRDPRSRTEILASHGISIPTKEQRAAARAQSQPAVAQATQTDATVLALIEKLDPNLAKQIGALTSQAPEANPLQGVVNDEAPPRPF